MARIFNLEIEVSNAAFEDDCGAEIARILRDVADRIEGMIRYDAKGRYIASIRDLNGNTVGKWSCGNTEAVS